MCNVSCHFCCLLHVVGCSLCVAGCRLFVRCSLVVAVRFCCLLFVVVLVGCCCSFCSVRG